MVLACAPAKLQEGDGALVLPNRVLNWRRHGCVCAGAGSQVDAFDAVVRINYAPTEGFEADVGSKTTFDLINQQHTKAFVPEVAAGTLRRGCLSAHA
eukprot:scaffold1572_cov329-Prasinococcus_capsulatus_cf.AAC.9